MVIMDTEDERGLTEHDKAMAKQTAKEFIRMVQQEVGASVLSKLFWSIMMLALGGGITYFSVKR